MKPSDIALSVLVMAVWASNIAAARLAAAEIPGWFLIAVRMTVILVVLLPFMRFPRDHLAKIFWLSLTMGTCHFGLMFVALEHIHVGTAALIVQTSVPFAVLLAWAVFREPLGWGRAAGIAISFSGIVLIVGAPHDAADLVYIGMALVSAFCFGIANLQLRGLGGVNAFSINGWLAIFCIPQMFLISLLTETGQWAALSAISWEATVAILHMGIVVSVVGHGLWYLIVPRYRTNQTMPFSLLIPVFGVSFGALIFGEPITWRVIAGGLVTITGVAIVIFRKPDALPVPSEGLAEPPPASAGAAAPASGSLPRGGTP
jgi:O-acetylserine/cysteine efflux transporter